MPQKTELRNTAEMRQAEKDKEDAAGDELIHVQDVGDGTGLYD